MRKRRTREKAASELPRKPLKRLSTKERHKRLLAKDRTYNEREDRLDRGIAGRSMVVDELTGGKDPGGMELRARQYQKIMDKRQEGESLRGKGPTFQRTPLTGKTKAKITRGYEHDPKGRPPVGWNKKKRDEI